MKDEPLAAREEAAIQGALRRIFTPPAVVPLPPAALAATGRGRARPARSAQRAWLARALVASAAGLAVLWLVARDPRPERREHIGELARGAPDGGPPAETSALRPAAEGALAGAGTPPARSPGAGSDLARLYADATRGRASMATCAAPGDLDAVRSELAERCGEPVFLRPEAAGILQGPFGSEELPGGTLLTGFPEGPLGEPSVLVAECDSGQRVCLDSGLPSSGPLHAFHARVGGIVLTEITPRDEPWLLELFDVHD